MTSKYIEAKRLLAFLEKKGVKVYEKPVNSLSTPQELRELRKNATVPSTNQKKNMPPPKIIPLTEEELSFAWEDLVVTEFLDKYPKTERYWADPLYRDQIYTLISFCPAPGATPDQDGVYGMIKVRGTFPNLTEMANRTRELLETVDSNHIYHEGYVGKPMPCTVDDRKFSSKSETVDIKNKAMECVSARARMVHESETKDSADVENRKQELLTRNENEKKGVVEPEEKYTEQRVRRAQIIYNIVEQRNAISEALGQLLVCNDELKKMDDSDPTLSEKYVEKYKKACSDVGIRENENSLIKYMVGPTPFDPNELKILPKTSK